MTEELDDKELNKMIAALLGGRSARRRGRPPTGFEKSIKYADQVWELRWRGVPSWTAITDVAEGNRKTPQHIAACVKMINDSPASEFWEHDKTDDPN
jgi:hypothetical protein